MVCKAVSDLLKIERSLSVKKNKTRTQEEQIKKFAKFIFDTHIVTIQHPIRKTVT